MPHSIMLELLVYKMSADGKKMNVFKDVVFSCLFILSTTQRHSVVFSFLSNKLFSEVFNYNLEEKSRRILLV